MDIVELENPEDIVESLISCAMDADKHGKTTALIANKELVIYAMGEVLAYDDFNVRKVDMELDDFEYMISIDKDGDVVVQPVMEYHDKFFEGIDIAFISMDGDVSQDIIDWLIDRDKDVTLFGLKDEDSCNGDCEKCDCKTTEFDTDDGYHITVKADLDADEALAAIKEMKSRMIHINDMFSEMDSFRRLFNW